MRWGSVRVGAAAAAAVGIAGCERLGLGPQTADSVQPVTAESPTLPDLRPHAGELYTDFMAQPGMDRFGPDALGLTSAEGARFEAAMPGTTTAELASGGGAEALVFAGCAPAGCGEGVAVLAIDVATGAAFVGVRDAAGADPLIPNARVEALLRLTSPSGRWDDARQAAAPAAP